MREIESSILRILNRQGQTIGTGFLVSANLAVTCAHVVALAGAVDGDTVQVQFTGREETIEALIEPKFWRATQSGDIAFLRLAQVPVGIIPLRLGLAKESTSGNSFFAFGYASAANIQGIATRGEIITLLPDGHLLQIRSHEADHGISGAPVFDEVRDVVIGMITKGHNELGRNQETTFATPMELLFQACPEIQPSEICPYLGLESFSAETERFFFGRTALTEKLLSTLSHGCRFLAVFGPSGSGKSSVVRAGLLPALKKNQPWAQITVRPAEDPFAQLHAAGLDLANLPATKTILFIDQFEELFACPASIRENFVRALADALEDPKLILIIAMRDDFYSAFNAKAAPLAASPDKVVVDVPITLDRADLIAMIEQPAEKVGLALEEGLTNVIIKDAAPDGSARSATLPLLEFTLTQLWYKRRDGLLTHDTYQSIGGVTGSLALWADDAYSALPKADKPLAESLLTALVHLGDEAQGMPDTRRRRTLTEFDEPIHRVITHFVNRRLLITSGETVELVHDALVREWSRLQGWIKSDRDNLHLWEDVSDAANQWEMSGEDESLLNHRSGRLDDALLLINNLRYRLTSLEQAYLKACITLREKEQREREQRLRLTVTASIIVTIIFFALGSFGLLKSNESVAQAGTAQANAVEAKRQAHISHANELAAQSIVNRDKNFQVSLLLGIEAFNISDTVQAQSVLMDNLRTNPQLQTYLIGHKDLVTSLAFSKDGKMLVSGSNDGTVLLWDVNRHKLIGQPLMKQLGNVTVVAFSIDGKMLASGTRDAKVILWDVATGQMVGQPFTGHLGPITSLAFSPDGKTLASASTDKTFSLWNINTQQRLAGPITINTDPSFRVTNIAFSPDGKILAASVSTDTILWDVDAKQTIGHPLNGYVSEVNALAFNPNGKTLVTGRSDGTIVVWDVEKQAAIFQSISVGASINAIAFSPDGNNLISGSDDGTIFLHNMDMESSFRGGSIAKNPGPVNTISFRADGKTFATNGNGSSIVLWHLEEHEHISQSIGASSNASYTGFGFSPDGTTLAAGTLDGNVFLWDLATNRLLSQQTTENTNYIFKIDFSPNSDILTLHRFGSSAILGWDLKTNQIIWPPLKDYDVIGISHNGKTLVLRDSDPASFSQLVFWDLTTRKQIRQPINGFTDIFAFSADDQILILRDVNANSMAFWDMEKQQLVGQPLTGYFSNFLQDGKTFLYITDDEYKLWDIKKQQQIGNTISPVKATYWMSALVMSPDEKILAMGTDYGRITILDMQTGQPIGQPFQLVTNTTVNLVFSPNSKLLASGGNDGSIILWDIATHQPIGQPIDNYNLMPDGIAFNPAGKSLAFVTTQNKIMLWDLDPTSWVQKTCEIVGRNFTINEWVLYFPNEEYRTTCPQWPAQPEIISTPAPVG